MDITILGIESSCDDTSAAVIRNNLLLSNVIASQAVHIKYGGVIPELASRAHQQNIIPVVDTALREAGLTVGEIDAIAFTRGPGLLGSLLVGGIVRQRGSRWRTTSRWSRSTTCRGISSALHRPARPRTAPSRLPVPLPAGQRRAYADRTRGFAARYGDHRHDDRRRRRRSVRQMRQSHGPALPRRPGDRPPGKGGQPPRRSAWHTPMSTATTIRSRGSRPRSSTCCATPWPTTPISSSATRPTSARRFRARSWRYCSTNWCGRRKTRASATSPSPGGVSANSGLRNGIVEQGLKRGWRTFLPEFKFTTDNAAMIAMAGYYHYQHGDFSSLDVSPVARLEEL